MWGGSMQIPTRKRIMHFTMMEIRGDVHMNGTWYISQFVILYFSLKNRTAMTCNEKGE